MTKCAPNGDLEELKRKSLKINCTIKQGQYEDIDRDENEQLIESDLHENKKFHAEILKQCSKFSKREKIQNISNFLYNKEFGDLVKNYPLVHEVSNESVQN